MRYQVTGFYFTTTKTGEKYVIYSTKTSQGRFASMHKCTGMSDEQAQGAFHVEHCNEVDLLVKQKKDADAKSRIITL